MTKGALHGTRVVEVGSSLASQFAGRILALMGAEVIKVEPPDGDPARRRGPFVNDVPNREGSTLFLYANMCKKGVTANPDTATGRSIVGALAASADVVLFDESDRLWCTAIKAPETPSAGAPAWILVSAFGTSGPYESRRLSEVSLYHAGGEGYLLPGGTTFLAYPDREPIKGPRYSGSFSAGSCIAAAAVLLMLARARSVPVAPVDLSEREALLQLLRAEIAQFGDDGSVASRAARSLPVAGLMPAKDGWVELYPLEPRMWASLIELMGHPAWATPELHTAAHQDPAASERLLANLADWTVQWSKTGLAEACQSVGVAAGAVLTIEEAYAAEQLQARDFFVPIRHKYAGELRYPVLPFGAALAEAESIFAAPLLGEHNVEVWTHVADVSPSDVCRMFEAGVI